MLKIFLVFVSILICTMNCSFAEAPSAKSSGENVSVMYKTPSKEQMRRQFEQRLSLSDKQKEEARVIHLQGRKEMKPVMMQIDLKRQEIENVKLTKLSDKEQSERISKLKNEISALEKQANEIRKKNTQAFENILNKTQRAELEKMKAEGRAKFEKNHQARPPFQGLGAPSFMFKPLLPPPDFTPWNK